MTDQLLAPPSHLSPRESLKLSQLAPKYFRAQRPSSLPYPVSLLATSESQEKWAAFENLLIACLRTGDDQAAFISLQELTARFGAGNERVQALRGLYEEAIAPDNAALDKVLKSYDEILLESPANLPIRKRRVALLKSLGRIEEATKALTELLDASPVDAEAWAELAETYFGLGALPQAVFALEEVLLITPNAWNIHARLGEVFFVSANGAEDAGSQLKFLSDAQRSFCRSIELCDDYLRGYYGLKITSKRLLDNLTKTSKPPKAPSDAAGDLPPPTLASVQSLHELSTKKLAEIIRRSMGGEKGWDGYDQAELIAARELLDRDTQSIQR